MTKHYVKFLHPGSLFPNESTIEIKNREAKFDIPESAFAYYFFDRQESVIDGELLAGNDKNISGKFLIGEELTVKDVKEKVSDNRILLSNMECNGYKTVCKTRRGNFYPVTDGDKVIQVKQTKKLR